ncbi:MAG: hypothetical protein ACLQIQ_11870 [Beijerinckiaceae bacterium]
MRLLLGIVIGIALAVGTARIADAFLPAPGPSADEVAARPMVNWDVVQHNLHGIASQIQEGWAHLIGH